MMPGFFTFKTSKHRKAKFKRMVANLRNRKAKNKAERQNRSIARRRATKS